MNGDSNATFLYVLTFNYVQHNCHGLALAHICQHCAKMQDIVSTTFYFVRFLSSLSFSPDLEVFVS